MFGDRDKSPGPEAENSDVTASCTYGGIRDHRELPEKLGVSRTGEALKDERSFEARFSNRYPWQQGIHRRQIHALPRTAARRR